MRNVSFKCELVMRETFLCNQSDSKKTNEFIKKINSLHNRYKRKNTDVARRVRLEYIF